MGKDGREGDAGRRANLEDRQFKTEGLVSGSKTAAVFITNIALQIGAIWNLAFKQHGKV